MATTARCEPSKLRNDAGLVEMWIGSAIVVVVLPLVEGVALLLLLLLYPESDIVGAGTLVVVFVMRSEEGGFGWSSGSPGGLNIASMVGRNAAPKGVERKSEGRSKWYMYQRTRRGKRRPTDLLSMEG
jgi:hypothetical protein